VRERAGSGLTRTPSTFQHFAPAAFLNIYLLPRACAWRARDIFKQHEQISALHRAYQAHDVLVRAFLRLGYRPVASTRRVMVARIAAAARQRDALCAAARSAISRHMTCRYRDSVFSRRPRRTTPTHTTLPSTHTTLLHLLILFLLRLHLRHVCCVLYDLHTFYGDDGDATIAIHAAARLTMAHHHESGDESGEKAGETSTA